MLISYTYGNALKKRYYGVKNVKKRERRNEKDGRERKNK